MATFNLGETVICSIEVRDADNVLTDPTTSMNIAICKTAPNDEDIIASTTMSNDSVGKYHYDYQSAGAKAGTYKVFYTATDGTRITIETDTFQLV